ncbi:hypothetical protein PHSC3_001081 [Chlamydiales bacterium STE3]|nr:hypothetical protein PHSC3_001081 [Chlamydiales bacterium STE3]
MAGTGFDRFYFQMEEFYMHPGDLFFKTAKRELNEDQQKIVAQTFCKMDFNKKNLAELEIPFPFKILSRNFFCRFIISVFFKESAATVLSAAVRKYQILTVQNFSKKIDESFSLNLTKWEMDKISSFISNLSWEEKFKQKVSQRAVRRFNKLSHTIEDLLKKQLHAKPDLWQDLLSDHRVDNYIEKIERFHTTSDNVLPTEGPQEGLEDSHFHATSDNAFNETNDEFLENNEGTDFVQNSEESTEFLFEIEDPADDGNISRGDVSTAKLQTLPYFFKSRQDCLDFLLGNLQDYSIIQNFSKLLAEYMGGGKSARTQKHFEAVFNHLIQSALQSSTIQDKNVEYQLNSSPDQEITFFNFLVPYLPIILEISQELAACDLQKLNLTQIENLLLNESKISSPFGPEKKIATVIAHFIEKLIDDLLTIATDENLKPEFLELFKLSAKGLPHQEKILGLAKKSEWLTKKFIKQVIPSYVPFVTLLKKKLTKLSKKHKELRHKIEELEKKCSMLGSAQEQMSDLTLQLKAKKLLDKSYANIKETLEESLRRGQTGEALALDQSLEKVYNEIYKVFLNAWIDNHSMGGLIDCINHYQQLNIDVVNLLNKSTFNNESQDKIKIKGSILRLTISILKEIQIYSLETRDHPLEAKFFSELQQHLLKNSLEPSSCNYTMQIWQRFMAPTIEGVLDVKGLFPYGNLDK